MSNVTNGTDALTLYVNRTYLDGNYATGILLGILGVLTWSCLTNLIKGKRAKEIKWGMLCYVVVLFTLAATFAGTNNKYVELMFNDAQYFYPGGTSAYQEIAGPPSFITSTVLYPIINALSDGLLVYRCYQIWRDHWIVLVVPVLTYLGTIAFSIPTLIYELDLNFTTSVGFYAVCLTWYGMTLALNVMITAMIAGRLLWVRKNLREVLGPEHAKIYTSISAMLIESGVLYSASNLILLLNTVFIGPFLNVWFTVHAMIIVISPFLIIDKVAQGRAYSNDITETLPTIRFHQQGTTGVPSSHMSQLETPGRSATTTIAITRFGKRSRTPSLPDDKDNEKIEEEVTA